MFNDSQDYKVKRNQSGHNICNVFLAIEQMFKYYRYCLHEHQQ